MNFLPYARENGGLGKMFYSLEKNRNLVLTSIFFLFAGFLVNISLTIIVLGVLLGTVFLFGVWCKRMIGGITGDTLGAVCEITETTVAVALSIFFNI